MAIELQLRRDTAANWNNLNPVLAEGELGIEIDTRYFKFGNGITSWSSLPYALADVDQDSNNRFVTDAEKAYWNGKADTEVSTETSDGLMSASDKIKLNGIESGANNYTHPTNHPPSIIIQDSSNRFVTDIEKSSWSSMIPSIQKGSANGVATLDSNSKIPTNQLPAIAITDTYTVSSQSDMLSLSLSEVGDIAIRTDLSKSFILNASPYNILSNWSELLSPTGAVSSVDGNTGVVNLSGTYAPLSHVGTGGTSHSNVVSSGDSGFMSGSDKNKLDGISIGATANSTDAYLLNRVNHTGTQDESTITNLVTDLAGKQPTLNGTGFVKASGSTITYDSNTYIPLSQKGIANGVATLDADVKVPISQLQTQYYYLSSNFSRNSATLADVTELSFDTTAGQVYRVEIIGLYQTGNTNTGGKLAVYLPSGAGTLIGFMKASIANTTVATELGIQLSAIGASNLAGSFILSTAVSVINTPHAIGGTMVFTCTTSGVFRVQWASETTTAARLNAGSAMIVTRLV